MSSAWNHNHYHHPRLYHQTDCNETKWKHKNHDVIDILPHACIESLFSFVPISIRQKRCVFEFLSSLSSSSSSSLFVVVVVYSLFERLLMVYRVRLSQTRKALNFLLLVCCCWCCSSNPFETDLLLGLDNRFLVFPFFMAKFIHNAEMISTFLLLALATLFWLVNEQKKTTTIFSVRKHFVTFRMIFDYICVSSWMCHQIWWSMRQYSQWSNQCHSSCTHTHQYRYCISVAKRQFMPIVSKLIVMHLWREEETNCTDLWLDAKMCWVHFSMQSNTNKITMKIHRIVLIVCRLDATLQISNHQNSKTE